MLGRSERVDDILQHILRGPSKHFESLREALEANGQKHVVETLLTPQGRSLMRENKDDTPPRLPSTFDTTQFDDWKDVIRHNRTEIVNNMNSSDEVLGELVKWGVLIDNLYQQLKVSFVAVFE